MSEFESMPLSSAKKMPPPPPVEALLVEEPEEIEETSSRDIEPTFEIKGFNNTQVFATLEKKNSSKGGLHENEDNVIADPKTGLIGVFDGLGGEGDGAKASSTAEFLLSKNFATQLKEINTRDPMDICEQIAEQQLKSLHGVTTPEQIQGVKTTIMNEMESLQRKDPTILKKALALLEGLQATNTGVRETGGKTTSCVGLIHSGIDAKRYAIVTNIGDSAAYKRRNTGEIIPLTREDSMLELLIGNGILTEEKLQKMKAAPDEKLLGQYSYKNLKMAMTSSLGAETVFPSLEIREMQPGEEIIFATDGFVDVFEDPQTLKTDTQSMEALAGSAGSQSERLELLRRAAKGSPSVKDDDVALVSARVL